MRLKSNHGATTHLLVGFLLGGFIPTCYTQTGVEIAKLENEMKKNEFAFYRKRIGQTQEKIAEVLGIPLEVYREIEENKIDVSDRVRNAFNELLTRFPGSVDLSKPKIKAIDEFRAQYQKINGNPPVGKHWIPFNFLGCEKILIDFSSYESDLNKGLIKTEKELWDWIKSHDLSPVITPEYFNYLSILNNRELQEEVQFWDEFYTAQHYGKYRSRKTPKELDEQFIKKREETRTYWINKTHKLLIQILIGLIGLWSLARVIVYLE